jgi:DNA-binding CsgD family transcriptional regulator
LSKTSVASETGPTTVENPLPSDSAAPPAGAILDAIPAHLAMIDDQGVITSVNLAWRLFACANKLGCPHAAVGQNYLVVCDRVLGAGSRQAESVADGIRSVLRRERAVFTTEYPCHSPDQRRWFLMTVTPLSPDPHTGALVMHLDITDRRESEEATRQRGRRITDVVRRYNTLSPRERQALEGLAKGLSSKQIALRLGLSTKTVEKHRANVMVKMGVGSLAEVVRAAVELGL